MEFHLAAGINLVIPTVDFRDGDLIVVVVGSGLDSFHSTEFGLVVVCRNFRGFAHFRRGGGECLVWFLLASCLLFAAPDPLNPILGRREIAFDGVDGGADGGAEKTKTYSGACTLLNTRVMVYKGLV